MKSAAGKGPAAGATLADASKSSLEQLLNKNTQKKRQKTTTESGVCGAPSRLNADEHDEELPLEDDEENEWDHVAGGDEAAADYADEPEDELPSGELRIFIEDPAEEEAPRKQRRKSVITSADSLA